MTEVKGNTPIASGHLYTTLARSLNKPKLDYTKQVECKKEKLKEEAGITHLINFYCGNVLGPLSLHEWDLCENQLEANLTKLIEAGKCSLTLSKSMAIYTCALWSEFLNLWVIRYEDGTFEMKNFNMRWNRTRALGATSGMEVERATMKIRKLARGLHHPTDGPPMYVRKVNGVHEPTKVVWRSIDLQGAL
ncbi:hypothetical protein CYMTET_17232 [Cymbomonas tetramitiformis]|uniref:Uncharacterized protein n=1 Tax=Cymbomonas tetramitiformis TaxID=36881 RepID=A0AAE0GAT7_9CHLO|nr:hypothetical protein CYMTET_17232 [Cymbomonas tetramitiformis]